MVVHITGRITKDQFKTLDKIAELERIDRSSVLRRIIDLGSKEYFRKKAVEGYRMGEMSIGMAAEVARVSIWEMYEILDREEITIKIDRKAIEERFAEDFGV